MSKLIKSTNSLISTLIAQLNLGSLCRLRYIIINNSKITFDIIHLLYKEGVIRLYILKKTKILVFFKYFKGCNLFKFKIISKPSKRIYMSLNKLSLNFSKNNFSGFFVISTPNGLMTSNTCLLYKYLSGEVLFKVFI
jgi:ribosomal protein S8